MKVTNHKCPNCNAALPFDPKSGLWVCQYCNVSFSEEELKKVKQEDEKIEEGSSNADIDSTTSNMDLYECPSCGAQIIADENTTATFCIYCKNPAIIKNKLKGEFKPEYVLPFKTNKNDAMNAFKKFMKGKPFTPKDFEKPENIQEISGIYIPFWLYSCDVGANIHADGKKVKMWRSGNYRYTKTDTYDVYRDGTARYEKIPADGSEKFADDIMDSIEPYDYDELKEFNLSYLSGFLAENYDVSKEVAFERAEDRLEQTSKTELQNTARGYNSLTVTDSNVNISNLIQQYVLLPVWLLNTKYKDKLYTFAMNGQTGKMVGNIPICKKKLLIKTLITFLITLITTIIFVYIYRGIGGNV